MKPFLSGSATRQSHRAGVFRFSGRNARASKGARPIEWKDPDIMGIIRITIGIEDTTGTIGTITEVTAEIATAGTGTVTNGIGTS
jgi:hypothetical protein